MRAMVATALGLALLLGVCGCGKKDSGGAAPGGPPPGAPAPAGAPPGSPTPTPPGAAPGAAGPSAPTAPGMPGPGAPAAGQPAPPAGETPKAAEPKAGEPKAAEPKAAKKDKDDDSDNPFGSTSDAKPASPPAADSKKPGKSTTAGALGRAFLRAAGASAPSTGDKAGK